MRAADPKATSVLGVPRDDFLNSMPVVKVPARLCDAGFMRRIQQGVAGHLDLLRELAASEFAITPKGNLTFHARRDDHVDSLALAARTFTRPRSEPGPPGVLRVRRAYPLSGGWWGP